MCLFASVSVSVYASLSVCICVCCIFCLLCLVSCVLRLVSCLVCLVSCLVLRIKLNSDASVDKHESRCIALGFLQRAGLHYHPDECYSHMRDPSHQHAPWLLSATRSTSRLITWMSPSHIVTVFWTLLIAFFLPSSTRLRRARVCGWYMLRGLYGTRQGGAVWANIFRD